MLSGTLSTSCMTTPHSSRRFCSLFSFFANTAPATSVRHVAATKYFFITDLHGQNFTTYDLLQTNVSPKGFSKLLHHERALRCPTLRRDTWLRTKRVSWLQRRARRFLPPNASPPGIGGLEIRVCFCA